ncbi:MAG: type II toxin-antitoxin system HipA family toxin [Planctomycetia bacterium]
MTTCRICLQPTAKADGFHPNCMERLYGAKKEPVLRFKPSELYAVAAGMAGKMSISGVQEKVSLKLSQDRSALEVAETGGRYILKPEPSRFSALPQNEHLTMCLASLAGVETPPFGLVPLSEGPPAYIIKRFDRLDDGTKLAVEDFCQLSERRLRDKYEGSAELCVKVVNKFATEPLIEILRLYRLLLFGWWSANGDMHLKNFSLLTTPNGARRLSPAYDLVCTRLVMPDDDTTALPMDGRNKNFTRRKWLDFGKYCRLPPKVVEKTIAGQIDALKPAVDMIHRSFLPDDHKDEYEKIVRKQTAVLAADSG